MTNATTLSIADINTTLDAEPRIQDLRLAQSLGFDRPRNIRLLIDRNRAELERYGEVCFTVKQTSPKGGRAGQECWLNEPQALLLCMFSRTAQAAAVRQELIGIYMEYRRGQSAPATPDPVQVVPPYCTGCAYHETNAFITLCNTLPGQAGAPLPLTAPPTEREMGIISDRRRDHEELRRGIRQEIAGFLVLDGVPPVQQAPRGQGRS